MERSIKETKKERQKERKKRKIETKKNNQERKNGRNKQILTLTLPLSCFHAFLFLIFPSFVPSKRIRGHDRFRFLFDSDDMAG